MKLSIVAFMLSLCAFHSAVLGIHLSASKAVIWKMENDIDSRLRKGSLVAAVLPGDPYVTGTISQGFANSFSIYSNVLLLRIALSWFPQLFNQFPVLRNLLVVTEPYLNVFRGVIPPVMGFDLSVLPAFFMLDILSQTAVAIGAEIPKNMKMSNGKLSPFLNNNNNKNERKKQEKKRFLFMSK